MAKRINQRKLKRIAKDFVYDGKPVAWIPYKIGRNKWTYVNINGYLLDREFKSVSMPIENNAAEVVTKEGKKAVLTFSHGLKDAEAGLPHTAVVGVGCKSFRALTRGDIIVSYSEGEEYLISQKEIIENGSEAKLGEACKHVYTSRELGITGFIEDPVMKSFIDTDGQEKFKFIGDRASKRTFTKVGRFVGMDPKCAVAEYVDENGQTKTTYVDAHGNTPSFQKHAVYVLQGELDEIEDMEEGAAQVYKDGKRYVLTTNGDLYENVNVNGVRKLLKDPSSFLEIPTRDFMDEAKIREYLHVVKDVLKRDLEIREDMSSVSDEYVKYIKDLSQSIDKKCQDEKRNVAEIYRDDAKTQQKANEAKNIIDKIGQ